MIARWFLALCLVVCANAGLAQTIEVRSGEHENFSRLVLNLPERIGYSLQKDGPRLRLEFERAGLSFDTSAIFERIPRTRLTSVDQLASGTGLDFVLDCDCPTRSFWFGETGLVVDLLDGPNLTNAMPTQEPQSLAQAKPVSPETPPEPGSFALARELMFERLDTQLGDQRTEEPAEDRELTLGRDELLLEFGKAASQGLVDPVVPLTRADGVDTEPARQKETKPPEDTVTVIAPPPPGPAQNMNLRAENVFDQSTREALRDGLAPVLPQGCLPPDHLNVATWGSDEPFSTQIGAARTRLVDVLDQPDASAVLDLARLYIFFGFGVEARELINRMDLPPRHGAILLTLADIIEDGQAGSRSALHGQLECAPRVAVWSALAYDKLPETEPLDLDAILQGFIALPDHLKAHLGPGLARRLLDAGYRHESARVQRLLSRGSEPATADTLMVEAELALNDAEGAEESLEQVVAANGDQSAEALMRLIEAKLDVGEPVSYDMAQLAGAYAHERRKTPEGADLARSHLAALAASGAFDEAFSRLDGINADFPGMEADLSKPLYDLLIQHADDFTFLKHALDRMSQTDDLLSPDTALGIADRLVALGFLPAAQMYLDSATTLQSTTAYRVLRARVALETGEAVSAEQILADTAGTEADALRARGLSAQGRHDEAQSLFEDAELQEDAVREALLEKDWSALSDSEIPGLSDIARARLSPSDMPLETQPLARGQAIIEQSGATRQALERMLEQFDVDALGQ
jgi:tetratricopeptide (TPR) repeat protein